jgi:hypothetical protein
VSLTVILVKRVTAGVLQLLNAGSSTLVVTHTGVINLLSSLHFLPRTYFVPLVEGLHITSNLVKTDTENKENIYNSLGVSIFTKNLKASL